MKVRHALIFVAILLFGVLIWGIIGHPRRGGITSAYQIQCAGNLKTISTFASMYADGKDGYFPYSPDGSTAVLQQVVDAFPDDFGPDVFICLHGVEIPALIVDGRLTLTPESCSYEVAPWRLRLTDKNAILYYDKKPHHRLRGRELRNVVLTDGNIIVMEEDAFQKRIREERARFSTPDNERTPNRPK